MIILTQPKGYGNAGTTFYTNSRPLRKSTGTQANKTQEDILVAQASSLCIKPCFTKELPTGWKPVPLVSFPLKLICHRSSTVSRGLK